MNQDHGIVADRRNLMVCLDCGAGVERGARCLVHPDEPVFDPSDPDVQTEMESRDTARKRKLQAFWSGLGMAVGLAYGLPFGFIYLRDVGSTMQEAIVIGCLLASPAVAFGNWLGRKRYRPQFQDWIHWTTERADLRDVKAANDGKGVPWWARMLG